MKKLIKLHELKEIAKLFKVLYVEDEVNIKTTMFKYLNKFFLKVMSASNGEEALEYYKKENFDIVITDLSMPRMNGLEMLAEIKKINENQAILITSAHSESEYMIKAIKSYLIARETVRNTIVVEGKKIYICKKKYNGENSNFFHAYSRRTGIFLLACKDRTKLIEDIKRKMKVINKKKKVKI